MPFDSFDIDTYLESFIERVDEVDRTKKDSHPGVRLDWHRVFSQMIIHTRGLIPVKLLSETRPNELLNIMEYRLNSYEPITQDGIEKGMDRLSRIFLNSNFRLDVSPRIAEYIEETKFHVKQLTDDPLTFTEFMLSSVMRADIEDPNAVLSWLPVNVDSRLPPSENPQTEKIGVKPVLVWSDNIVDYSKDLFSFRGGHHHFKVKNDWHKAPFYYVMTTKVIWIVLPVGFEKGEIVYKSTVWYELAKDGSDENAFPFVPAVLLKGEQVANVDNEVYYQSFFNSYVAAGNQAIRGFSDWQAVMVQCNFPVITVKGQVCWRCQGKAMVRVEPIEEGKPKFKVCETCSGGVTTALSPNSTYIKRPPKDTELEGFVLSPSVEFDSPDTGILDKSLEAWQIMLDRAERSINVKFSEDAQSGVSKDKDLEQMLDMVNKISKNMFRIVKQSLTIIEAYREPFATNREGSKITEPTEFRIKSQAELTSELTTLIKDKAPQSFIFNAATNLSKELYNGDPVKQKIVEVQGVYDPLFGKSPDDINKLKVMGAITNADVVLHVNAFTILMQVASENKDFAEMSFEDIKSKADEILLTFLPAPAVPLTDPNGLGFPPTA